MKLYCCNYCMVHWPLGPLTMGRSACCLSLTELCLCFYAAQYATCNILRIKEFSCYARHVMATECALLQMTVMIIIFNNNNNKCELYACENMFFLQSDIQFAWLCVWFIQLMLSLISFTSQSIF